MNETRDELYRAIYDFAEQYRFYDPGEDEEHDAFAYDFVQHLTSKFDIKLKESE